MNIKSIGLIAGIVLFGFTASASATIVDVTYTGTVTASRDETGIFGIAGISTYLNQSYVANFIFDPTVLAAPRAKIMLMAEPHFLALPLLRLAPA
jgi:hypothetical protein